MSAPSSLFHPGSFVTMPARLQVCAVLVIAVSAAQERCAVADDQNAFFEKFVRPVLVEKCSKCHGAHHQNGGFRVDSLAAILKGGDTGHAVVPGQPDRSLLITAVEGSEELSMPPDEPLTRQQIQALRRWIGDGARWPAQITQLPSEQDQSWKEHWAFQPVQKTQPPKTTDPWVRTPIDAFILRRLTSAELRPAQKADRRTLLRRAGYALTGLPPSWEAIEEFVADDQPDAWNRLVDKLLDSPHYGEQWARHWLDVARYADTKGYVYAREERFWIHAWTYRDWVVSALNDDMPYNRFLQLQIAADQVETSTTADQAAMGFLTLGRRFLGIRHDIIDDRIDVVCRGTMGLTVACARCHDHKYDPIPTADYYSLYGVFDSSYEKVIPIADVPAKDSAFIEELAKRQKTLTEERRKTCAEASRRNRERIDEYLLAQTELHKYPQAGFDQVIAVQDVHPRLVYRWSRWLYNAGRRKDPVFRAWREYSRIPQEKFSQQAAAVTQTLRTLTPEELNPIVANMFQAPPASFRSVVQQYSELFRNIDTQWKELAAAAEKNGTGPPESLPLPEEEQLRKILYGPASPCTIPDVHISNIESLLPSGEVTRLWKQQGEVDRWIIQSKYNFPHALTLADRPVPQEPRIFRRGSATNPGAPVSRHFLTLFSAGAEPLLFTSGSGRRELADAIIDPNNPLTARVMVNRVWAQHFGRGLVSTPSDFGLRAEPPSHPQLLDWLASWFVENGWQLKKLHRLIMTSAVYQQASGQLEGSSIQVAQNTDPDNRLLWRTTPHRLTFEEFRDSLLMAAGKLRTDTGGKPFDLFAKDAPARRTIYGLIDRQYLPRYAADL